MTTAALNRRRYYKLRKAGMCVACAAPSAGRAKCDNCRQLYKRRQIELHS